MTPVKQADMCMSLSVFLFPNILNDMWFLRSKSILRNILEDKLTNGIWNETY